MTEILNLEIKARTNNIVEIRRYLQKNCTEFLGIDHQKDTYFKIPKGRLKLRQGNIENSLIYYFREEVAGIKQSNINLVKVMPNSGMEELLRNSNGILTVVNKKREIYFIENVKFHIDEVDGLGFFVEIEAIDEVGKFQAEELREQCSKFISLFKINSQEMIKGSYSDMTLEAGQEFKKIIFKQFQSFYGCIAKYFTEKKWNINHLLLDHACYRVTTQEEYLNLKNKFSLIGELLIESIVSGRPIATYKLYEPLQIGGREISVIELPSPKPGNTYELGFEHVEFVIDEDFVTFSKRYKDVNFDWSAANKNINAEIKVKLERNLSVKFHHEPLDVIIKKEKQLSTNY